MAQNNIVGMGMGPCAAAEGAQFASVVVGRSYPEPEYKAILDKITELGNPEFRPSCAPHDPQDCTCEHDVRGVSVADYCAFDGSAVGPFTGACRGCIDTTWTFKMAVGNISPDSWYEGTPADADRRLKASAPFALLAGMCGDNRRVPHAALLEMAKAVRESMILA